MYVQLKWLLLVYVMLFSVTAVQAQQRRIACIGDSVTKGYGLQDTTASYPKQLQQLLGDDYLVGNFGHSGATLLSKGHQPYILTKAYKEALAFKADVIILALGLNDTDPRNWPNYRQDFVGDYTRLIQDFKAVNPHVEVFICLMTPIFSGHARFLSGTRDWFHQIQGLLPDIAAAHDAVLIDNHNILSARMDLFADFLHPNAEGASLIATNVFHHLVPVDYSLQVDAIFGSHMVLQRGKINRIQGVAPAYSDVKMVFKGQQYTGRASSLGRWEMNIPEQPAGGPYDIKISTDKEQLLLSDILFGDVYLSSGQSNMAFPVDQALHASSMLERAASYPQIRLFKNINLAETNPNSWDLQTLKKVNKLDFFSGAWELSSQQSVASFSAIAYATALSLHQSQGVPIGIIDLSVGGSNAESWIPRQALEQDNLLATYIHSWKTSDFVQEFCRSRATKNLEHAQQKHQRHPYDPAYNFEAGLSKWTQTNINGVLWYQGESNAHNIEHYTYVTKALIDSWRAAFKQEVPFYMVQLSSINRPSWGHFRDAQRQLSNALPKVYLAISYDKGDVQDVHPKEKFEIGYRLANLIRQHAYGVTIQANSPQPIGYSWDKDLLTIRFSDCSSLKTVGSSAIEDLYLINTKGLRSPVEGIKLSRNTIQFKVARDAQFVQYAYSPYTNGNLRSDTDIPVSTFELRLQK